MAGDATAGEPYSAKVAYVYIFNLIVGIGALALPVGFQSAGLILGLIFLIVVGFLAFVTVTWVTEAQACANALLVLQDQKRNVGSDVYNNTLLTDGQENINGENLNAPLLSANFHTGVSETLNVFEIKQRVEFGRMSELFLGKVGQKIFYAIYLYGDLAIYAVTVPKSLSAVTKTWIQTSSVDISYDNVYYLYLALFTICILPFTFFNFQRTKWLQYATLGTRNISLFLMIILGLVYIGQGHGTSVSSVRWFDITGLPNLFGVSIYAFMCHHSLPSIITPITSKTHLTKLFGFDFLSVYVTYSLLCVSALFAFGGVTNPSCNPVPGPPCTIQQLYTLNFQSFNVRPIAIFLALFPVFTLSANFPLISITLRNNLMNLIPYGETSLSPMLRRIIFSLVSYKMYACLRHYITCGPPILIAFCTQNVDLLVNITGSYAGLGIMFIIPAFLVFYARRKMGTIFGPIMINPHRSPFVHKAWIYVILAACLVSFAFITYNHIAALIKH